VLRKLKEDTEAELLKLQYRGERRGDEVLRQYSKELIRILRSGGLWAGQDLLKALHISPTDAEAVGIVFKSLRNLESYGLVQEDISGWRWLK